MKLVVNSEGVYLTKVGECFCLKKEGQKQEIAAKKVEQIIITTSTALSTDAIELAIENNIDIVFLKKYGKPFGRVWHSKVGSISTIRKRQLNLDSNKMGTILVKEFLTQKMIYFSRLSDLMPEKYKFNGRSKNPAKDEFNCMLNYGYGIMYSNVERACILAGLDPYIGIMHVDNYNRQAFVFDLIEMYRIYIDKIVFKLFTTKKVKKEHFDKVEGGLYLNKAGKEILISKYNEEIEKKIQYKGRKIELQNIIQYDCHNIANKILNGGD